MATFRERFRYATVRRTPSDSLLTSVSLTAIVNFTGYPFRCVYLACMGRSSLLVTSEGMSPFPLCWLRIISCRAYVLQQPYAVPPLEAGVYSSFRRVSRSYTFIGILVT